MATDWEPRVGKDVPDPVGTGRVRGTGWDSLGRAGCKDGKTSKQNWFISTFSKENSSLF